MGEEITGACIGIWREKPLQETYKGILMLYADYLNSVSGSLTIRFIKPDIRTKSEERQIVKAIGYLPKEEILVCGFLEVLINSAYEIMDKFGGHLLVGAPEELILKTTGKCHLIRYFDNTGVSKILRSYHISDCEFVKNYFNIGYNPKIKNICSLNEYTIHGFSLKDLLINKTSN